MPSILLPVRRIVAIGDLHGDYKATLLALRKSNLINEKNKWIGGKTVVVQLGDQIDRENRSENITDEDSELKIMNLFDRLHKQAQIDGGAVYSLIGNHELMNVLGDFSYTSKRGIEHFGSEEERLKHFQPGGRIAKKMANTRNVIIRIGDWVFVHGGITTRLAKKYKISEINLLMKQFLLGDHKLERDTRFRELFLNGSSLLWSRRYSEEQVDCKALTNALQYLGAKHIVVAHTVQDKINCRCNGKVYRIDVGMSKSFGKKNRQDDRIQVLEIIDNGKKVNII